MEGSLRTFGIALSLAGGLAGYAHGVEVTAGKLANGGESVSMQGLPGSLTDLESRVSTSTARLFKIKECHEKGQFLTKFPDGTEDCKDVLTGRGGCILPWGGVVEEGAGAMAFANPHVPAGYACAAEARYCTNGTLSGSYRYPTCTTLPDVVVLPARP
jgi:hypothetical protein